MARATSDAAKPTPGARSLKEGACVTVASQTSELGFGELAALGQFCRWKSGAHRLGPTPSWWWVWGSRSAEHRVGRRGSARRPLVARLVEFDRPLATRALTCERDGRRDLRGGALVPTGAAALFRGRVRLQRGAARAAARHGGRPAHLVRQLASGLVVLFAQHPPGLRGVRLAPAARRGQGRALLDLRHAHLRLLAHGGARGGNARVPPRLDVRPAQAGALHGGLPSARYTARGRRDRPTRGAERAGRVARQRLPRQRGRRVRARRRG